MSYFLLLYNGIIEKSIDIIYDLIKTGNFIALVILAVLAIIFFFIYRYPESELPNALSLIISFLSSEKFYLFPLIVALSFCMYTNFMQKKIYKSEVKRLTEHRKKVIHGIMAGELEELVEHKSSNFNIDND